MLIIVDYCVIFSDQDLCAFILEGRKENKTSTCDSDDEKPKCKFCKKKKVIA
jgi:hypothetical protein